MKLRALIERLEELEADLVATLGEDVEPEVLCAYQRSWPLVGSIDGACVLGGGDDEDEEDGEGQPELLDGCPVVWIAIGEHPDKISPYAPDRVFTEAE